MIGGQSLCGMYMIDHENIVDSKGDKMTIFESPKDDVELALLVLAEQEGSQRFPVPWTVRLATRVIQQDNLIKASTNQIKDLTNQILSNLVEDNGKIISTISSGCNRSER